MTNERDADVRFPPSSGLARPWIYPIFSEVKQVAGMEVRAALMERLKRHPELACNEIPGGVRIEPPGPGGFAVEVRGEGEEWTVYLGSAGFHETFHSGGEALNFVAWCYSGEARLREVWRGGVPAGAALEAREEGAWRCVSETRLIFVPFWRRRREVVLENPNFLRS